MKYAVTETIIKIFIVLLSALFLFPGFFVRAQGYMINEIAPDNDYFTDDYGELDDWIELYNNDVNTAWLDEVYLTDDFDEPFKWKIDGPYKMQPGGFLIIWLDGQPQQGALHAPFKLKSGGEQIAITQLIGNDIVWIDSLTFGPVLPNTTLGRISDGNPLFALLTDITPGLSNNGSNLYMGAPRFLPEGKIIDQSQKITLTAPESSSQVYYTLDGSEPTMQSTLYEGPFNIDTTLQVNARAFKTGYAGSTSRETYILKPLGNIPVLSLELARKDLFDDEHGIYVKGTNGAYGYCLDYPANWNQDWEKPGRITMFEPDGVKAFSCNTGIKIGGGCSRGLNMKSFNLFLREEYGDPFIPYQIFPGSRIDDYHRIKIRNAGTDNGSMLMRDGVNQILFRDEIDLDLMDYRPAALYLNSEFWGIYGIREFINQDYIYSHHGYKEDEIDLIKSPYEWPEIKLGDDSAFQKLFSFIKSHDLREQENYQYVEELIDINEYINYNIAEIYLANYDWPSINSYVWKPREGGKWRWILVDIDGSTNFDLFYDTYPAYNSIMHATIPFSENWPNSERSTLFLRKLLENEGFKNEFAQRACTYMELLFHPDRVDRITDSIAALIDPFVDQTLDKWGKNIPELGWGQAMGGSRDKWEENIQLYKDFFEERPFYMKKYIGEYCRFEGSYRLNLGTDLNSHGKVYVNSNRKEVPIGFGADYFQNIPLKLYAKPDEGYAFYKWQEIDDPNPEIDFIASGNMTLTPLFIPANSVRGYERSEMKIYPNPSGGFINILFDGLSGDRVHLEIFNSSGQMVLNEMLPGDREYETWQLDLSEFPNGIYSVKVHSKNTQMVEQLILIRE